MYELACYMTTGALARKTLLPVAIFLSKPMYMLQECRLPYHFQILVSGVRLVSSLAHCAKSHQACVLSFGPMASCRISFERDILAVLYSRLRSSH